LKAFGQGAGSELIRRDRPRDERAVYRRGGRLLQGVRLWNWTPEEAVVPRQVFYIEEKRYLQEFLTSIIRLDSAESASSGPSTRGGEGGLDLPFFLEESLRPGGGSDQEREVNLDESSFIH